jgi:hypothetical protein
LPILEEDEDEQSDDGVDDAGEDAEQVFRLEDAAEVEV